MIWRSRQYFELKRVSFLYPLLLKATLMQISKSPYMFVFRKTQYLENFAFLILRIVELFAREVCKFLKK